MKNLLYILSFLLFAFQCNDGHDCCPGPPTCANTLMTTLTDEPVRNPPAKVVQIEFEGSTYYYVPPYCCDQFGTLYDDECNVVCHPDGGVIGNGDGNCPDVDIQSGVVIWEDQRTN